MGEGLHQVIGGKSGAFGQVEINILYFRLAAEQIVRHGAEAATDFDDHRAVRLKQSGNPVGATMMELGAGAHQRALKTYSEGIADWGYGQVAQRETIARLSPPIIQAIQGVGEIDASVQIRRLTPKVSAGHSVRDGGKPCAAGIAKEVGVHAAQGCDVVHQERFPHRSQATVTYLLPPPGDTIRRMTPVMNGRLVGCAYSFQ